MKKTLIIIFLILIIFQIHNFSLAEEISVGIYQNPPLVGMSEEGDAEGFFVDIVNYIADEEDWTLNYSLDSLNQNFKKIETDELDLLLAIAHTEKRDEKYIYNSETL